jgi:hypothetical protein
MLGSFHVAQANECLDKIEEDPCFVLIWRIRAFGPARVRLAARVLLLASRFAKWILRTNTWKGK